MAEQWKLNCINRKNFYRKNQIAFYAIQMESKEETKQQLYLPFDQRVGTLVQEKKNSYAEILHYPQMLKQIERTGYLMQKLHYETVFYVDSDYGVEVCQRLLYYHRDYEWQVVQNQASKQLSQHDLVVSQLLDLVNISQ